MKSGLNLMRMNKKGFAFIAILLTVSNFLGKILGFAKDLLISYYYGATDLTDALFLALSIPTIILGVFTSSTDSAIIPQYNRLFISKGKLFADRHFSTILNSILTLGLFVSVFIVVYPEWFVSLFAPGFSDIQRTYATWFLRLFSFVGFFHILYCFLCTYIIRYKNVWIRSVLSFSTNLVVVIALLISPDKHMITLSYAFLIASIVQGVLPVIGMIKLKYKHIFSFEDFGDLEYKKFWLLFMPIMGAAFLTNLNFFIDKYLATNFEEGSVSFLNYSFRITSIFDSIIVVGLGVVILPLLSDLNINGSKEKFKNVISSTVMRTVAVLTPIAICVLLYSKEIIHVVYFRGKFGIEPVKNVAELLFYYAPLILLIPLKSIMSRFFHSLENTKTPLRITIGSVVLNIVLSVFLSKIMGLKGIALATSISLLCNIVLNFYYLNKITGWSLYYFNFVDITKLISLLVLLTIIFNIFKELINNSYLIILLVVPLVLLLFYYSLYIIFRKKYEKLFTK